MKLDDAGLLAEARYLPSPNCDDRPVDVAIELLVIHNISLPPGEFGGDAIADLFLNRLDPQAHPYYEGIANLRVSSHFLIRRDGALLQFVPCAKRAWHAGLSQWSGREKCNDFSIGIELEGADDVPFSDAQYECLSVLARALYARYPVKASVGHSDIAPGRKTDPGPHFSWTRYFSALEK
jgi:AmpD protein